MSKKPKNRYKAEKRHKELERKKKKEKKKEDRLLNKQQKNEYPRNGQEQVDE